MSIYPVVSLKQARQLAQAERAKLASNIDLSIDRKINKQKTKKSAANSFEAIAHKWHRIKVPPIRTSKYTKDVLRRPERNIYSYIGIYPINQIKPPLQQLFDVRFINNSTETTNLCGMTRLRLWSIPVR